MNEETLYWSGHGAGLTDVLRSTYDKAMADVRALNSLKLDSMNDDELHAEIYKSYFVEAPVFDRENIKVEIKEEDIPSRMHPNNFLFADEDSPSFIKAHVAHVYIPFEGEAEVMNYTPSSYSTLLPRGEVRGKTVFFKVVLFQADGAELDKKIDEHLKVLLSFAETAKKDSDGHNRRLHNDLPQAINERRNKLTKDNEGFKDSKYL